MTLIQLKAMSKPMHPTTRPIIKSCLWIVHASLGRRPITVANDTAAELELLASRATTKAAGDTTLLQRRQLWERVKKELIHYWHGTKLLGKEIEVSLALASRLAQGNKLTRREQQQLRKTSRDLLRLIPFSVFVIVPFMEFLLPVALKLFPNMLPSTFEDSLTQQEKIRKLAKVRLEMAKFLQESIKEPNIHGTRRAAVAQEFDEFFKKIRATGEQPSTQELLHIASLFPEGLTFDSFSRPQLISVCRYMNLNAIGTSTILRYQIQIKMNSIKKDDKLIAEEGVNSLTTKELQIACQHRGIPTNGVSSERLRRELTQWLDIHLTHSIPHSILILSRALSLSDTTTNEAQHVVAESSTEETKVIQAEKRLLKLFKALNIT
ncbi:hypothetical protein BGZ46_008834 [Entomortierella lignicola]|nr:hypothetical protein BGZ46_008834 [Entomortierella lignicola]